MSSPKLNDNTIYLIDGSGYIFRAFFAIRSLHSKSGVPTNAVYGFTNMLIKLLREHNPKYIGIAFDKKAPTFRHKIFPAYKANRPAPPEELLPQFDLIHRVVEAFNIKILTLSGFEADDLIGTVAKRAQAEGREVVVVSGDKDLMQLVDDRTFLLDELRASRNGSEQFFDRDAVKEDLGVWPEQVVDMLALMGDSSDNVPGISGIGKKTAVDLINEFGSLDKVLTCALLIKQKSRREKIVLGQASARLSKELVTINTNAPIDCTIEDLRFLDINQEKTRKLFLELDFNRLLTDGRLLKKSVDGHPIKSPVDRGRYRSITKRDELNELVASLRATEKIALDTETDSLDNMSANLVGIALAMGENEACYIPIGHNKTRVFTEFDLTAVRSALNEILLDTSKTFVAQNAKFDHKILVRHGFLEFKIGGDPMLANYLLHQDQEQHSLDDLSLKYLHHKPITFDEICGSKKDRISFSEVLLKEATEYAAEDADLALRLENLLLRDLKSASLDKLYYDLELPLEEVLSRMEMNGVQIDTEVLAKVGEELRTRLKDLEAKAHQLAGFAFNLASPKQTSSVLFEKLGLPTAKKTKTGYSTDAAVLERLASSHPMAELLLEHRLCAKLLNTYIEALPLLVNRATGRLHTSYNQFVTATGRLSSSDPNLQNIPVRGSLGRRIREAFIARPGYHLISLDYSQVELRILAYVTKDPVLLDSFAKDEDVHCRTASEIFDVPSDRITKEQRNAAKTINFGLLYGMGAQRLAQTLGISRKDAQSYLDKYFAKYAGIKQWKNEALIHAQKSGEVRTLFGRKRLLRELSSKNALERARGERIAINTPIQGTAADIIKMAMIDADLYLRQHSLGGHLIMQVHDELVIEARAEESQRIAEAVSRIMSQGHGLPLNLKVDYGIANNWADAH